MRSSGIIIALALATASALPAYAGVSVRNTDFTLAGIGFIAFAMSANQSTLADKNLYVGGQIGAGRVGFTSAGNGTVENQNQFAYGLHYGYWYRENLAMEMSLNQVGLFYTQAGGTQYATMIDVFAITAVGRLPLNDSLALLGKAGAGISFVDGYASNHDQPGTSRLAPLFGAAIQYELSKNVSLRLNWDHYAVSACVPQGPSMGGIRQNANASVVSAGLEYRF